MTDEETKARANRNYLEYVRTLRDRQKAGEKLDCDQLQMIHDGSESEFEIFSPNKNEIKWQ